MLSKLGVPANIYFHFDECLKELRNRREQVELQMNLYKANQYYEPDIIVSNLQKSDSFSNSSHMLSDANSDISSCLDSNYESDYSANSFHSSKFKMLTLKSLQNEHSSKLSEESTIIAEETQRLSLDLDSSAKELNRQNTNSSVVNNSDDSDVTIGESFSRKMSDQLEVIKSNSESGNEGAMAIALPETSESSSITQMLNLENVNLLENYDPTQKSKFFLRQISDGYMSSNTPLSANSICENPTVNPFFISSDK